MSELSCAVILCTRNRPAMLADALDAVVPTLRPGDELVVVDSASDTDETRRVAADRGVRVVRAARKGLSRARNLGVAETVADIVVFTDDDCRPQPGWLDRLTGGFTDAQVGFVLGQVRADVEAAHLPFDANRPRPAARFDGPTDPIELGNGACMAFRRVAYDAIGGADERLGAGTGLQSAEDHDLFCRLLHHRWIGVYEPEALVLHRDWRTHREVVRYNWGVGLGTGAMVAKLWRIADTSTVAPLLRRRIVTDGVQELARNVAQRDKSAIVAHTSETRRNARGVRSRPRDAPRRRTLPLSLRARPRSAVGRETACVSDQLREQGVIERRVLYVSRELAVCTESRGADAVVVEDRQLEPILRRVPVCRFERCDRDPLDEHRMLIEHRRTTDAPPARPRRREQRGQAAIVEKREPAAERGEPATSLSRLLLPRHAPSSHRLLDVA